MSKSLILTQASLGDEVMPAAVATGSRFGWGERTVCSMNGCPASPSLAGEFCGAFLSMMPSSKEASWFPEATGSSPPPGMSESVRAWGLRGVGVPLPLAWMWSLRLPTNPGS